MHRPTSRLDPKKRYLQIALNNTLEEAHRIIARLPVSDRILVEAGTPLIKRYGEEGIQQIRRWCAERFAADEPNDETHTRWRGWFGVAPSTETPQPPTATDPYVVADLKTMDRGEAEVALAARGGASAAIALGSAPIETLNAFITACEEHGLDAMIDMMNVDYPLSVLRALKRIPPVVILHRGVDEEHFNKEKQIPLHEIRRIKGSHDVMISIAGGDTIREVQRAVFNDADIIVVWKSVFASTERTVELVEGFLKEIR